MPGTREGALVDVNLEYVVEQCDLRQPWQLRSDIGLERGVGAIGTDLAFVADDVIVAAVGRWRQWERGGAATNGVPTVCHAMILQQVGGWGGVHVDSDLGICSRGTLIRSAMFCDRTEQ